MGMLSRLTTKLNGFCTLGMMATGIAVFVLGLGEWTFLGVRVFTIFEIFTLTLLASHFIQDLIIMPAISGQAAKLAKQIIMLAGDETSSAGQVTFAGEVIDAEAGLTKVSFRIGAIVALIAYFVLGPRVGSPISEIVAILILNFGPLAVVALGQGQVTRMRALDPNLYDPALGVYRSIDSSIHEGGDLEVVETRAAKLWYVLLH